MLTKIQKWGNSQGFRIPKSILESVNIEIGDNVDIKIIDGNIILCPIDKIRGRFNIDNLIKGKIDKDDEYNCGDVRGAEVW